MNDRKVREAGVALALELGNVAKAARKTKIAEATLRRWVKRHREKEEREKLAALEALARDGLLAWMEKGTARFLLEVLDYAEEKRYGHMEALAGLRILADKRRDLAKLEGARGDPGELDELIASVKEAAAARRAAGGGGAGGGEQGCGEQGCGERGAG